MQDCPLKRPCKSFQDNVIFSVEKAVLIKEIWLENSVSAIEHIGNRKSIFEIPPVIN